MAPSWIFCYGLDVPRSACRCAPDITVSFVLGGRFAGRHEAPHADRIGGDGLLGEHVLSGVNRRFEMHRPVAGRRGQHHDVDVGVDQFLVGVETDEMMVRIDLDARRGWMRPGLRRSSPRLAVALHGNAACAGDEFGIRSRASDASRWSSKTSAMATSSTFSLPVSRSTTACVPRPPQPTMPARSFSLPAPRTRWGLTMVKADPAAATFRSSDRREIEFD